MTNSLVRWLKERVEPIKTKVLSILLEASQLDINEREKTPLAKTVRTCRNLLKLEVALWLFISSDGVEPTNNAALESHSPCCDAGDGLALVQIQQQEVCLLPVYSPSCLLSSCKTGIFLSS